MDTPGYWIPYRTDDPGHACFMVGPFESVHHADLARESMQKAARPTEFVGEVLFADSEALAQQQFAEESEFRSDIHR